MTEIFVTIPFKILQERIESSKQIKQLISKLYPHLIIQNVFWSSLNPSKLPSQETPKNKCILELHQTHNIRFLEALEQKNINQRLQNTQLNLKQDLRQLMRIYQDLKRQHVKLIKSNTNSYKDKQNSAICQSLQGKEERFKYLPTQHKQTPIQDPLSLSLEVNSKITSQRQKSVFITLNDYGIKNTVFSLEKQISNLTRENLQLKNTTIYYQSRLQFIGEYLKKLEEEKEKEKKQIKQTKKERK